MSTERVRLGLMVGANPYRNPALVAKMVTALDHISDGRMYLGIGSAWDESEARAFGIDMGESPGERLRWLREALPVMRGMLRGEEPSATGPRYAMDGVRNDPPPVQSALPIVVGGGGENVTLAPRRALRGCVQHRLRRGPRGIQAQGRALCAGTARRSAVTSARSSAR